MGFFIGFLLQPQTGTFCIWGGSAGTTAKPEPAASSHGVGTQNPTQLYGLTCSETLGPLLSSMSSAHEAANRVSFLPNKQGLQARSQPLARGAGQRVIHHVQ